VAARRRQGRLLGPRGAEVQSMHPTSCSRLTARAALA